ncbi:MAG: glycosyltransferase family 4 protein [Mucinivorans sp.]
MKIIIVGPAWPFRGGIAQLDESLAGELSAVGHQVSIVSLTTQYPSILFPGKSQFTDAPKPEGLAVERLISSINPITWFRAAGRIAKAEPDLVIVRYWMSFMAPALGTLCGRLRAKGLKVLAITDNIIPHERHFYDRFCARYFLRATSGVLYMSNEVGRELSEIFSYARPTVFSPHPIYDVYGQRISRAQACLELGLDPSKRYALFFGFIRDYKGLDLLLDAWEPRSDRELIVAGEFYADREKFMPLIEQKSVILHDMYIPEHRVRLYFSVASLVVQPYKTATQSGVTQIAYNFGVPMVVSNVGGLPEIVPDGVVGFVVEPRAAAINGAINRFFDQNFEPLFRENIEREKKRFEWSTMVTRIEELSKNI